MNNLDKQYTDLLQDILDNGVEKDTRNGKTLSVFGRTIRYKFKDGKFPLLTTKKMYMKGIITELLWFLRGDTSIKYLVDNGCHIWDGDAYKAYLKGGDIKWLKQVEVNTLLGKMNVPIPYSQEEFINKIKTDDEFAKKWGELGPIYGKQWRSWKNFKTIHVDQIDKSESIYKIHSTEFNHIDQIANLINDLKTNPDSRRLMVSAWNVGELDQMVLPPCHYGFQVYTRELTFPEKFNLAVGKKGEWEQNMKNMEEGRSFYLSPAGIESRFDEPNFPKRAISLMWNQRSVDTFLGLPFNIASYGLLLEIIAKEVNMVPDELIGNLGDTHLYLNHIEQAKEQIGRELSSKERTALGSNGSTRLYDMIKEGNYETLDADIEMHKVCDEAGVPKRTREPYPLPTLRISSEPLDDIAHHEIMDFDILNYQSHPTIKAPLSN